MRPLLFALVLSTLAAAPVTPPLFPCRVALDPLVARLKAAGGDPARAVHVRTLGDLERLANGRRYKFVLTREGELVLSPLPADEPGNEYTHPVLAGGAPVRTAGGLTVERAAGHSTIVLDQDSQAYCPSRESLREAASALALLGAPATSITTRDQPPRCAPPP